MERKLASRVGAVSTSRRQAVSKRSDDIFEGSLAVSWIEAMGTFGDPIRTSIVNPIAAFVTDYFVANPLRPSTRSPRNLIQQALHKVAEELGRANYGKKNCSLEQWHADTKRLTALYPHLKDAVVWDLGCGEGHLTRWLATLGSRSVGVEPSEALAKYAGSKSPSTSIFTATIQEFFNKHASQAVALKPTLLTLISVLDACANADLVLEQINTFMRKHSLEVPLLVATLDPDFFCAGLPKSPINSGVIRWFDNDHEFTMRDPAQWEIAFAENNYHVLDQRPVHLDLLPPNLTRYVLGLCREQIRFDADPVDLIAPRQGPFYFWVISPRPRTRVRSTRVPTLTVNLPKEVVTFEAKEIIEVKANIGSKVYEVLEGSTHFDYAGLFEMVFSEGMFFGQLEVSQNYFASRMLGPIVAQERTVS